MCSSHAADQGGLSPFHFAHLNIYAEGDGPLSTHLRQCLKGNVIADSRDPVYLHSAQQRGKILNEYHQFLNSSGIRLGRVFGFGYEPRSIPLKIQRGIDKLRFKIMGSIHIPGWQEAC